MGGVRPPVAAAGGGAELVEEDHGRAWQTLPATSSIRVLHPRLLHCTAHRDVASHIFQALAQILPDTCRHAFSTLVS